MSAFSYKTLFVADTGDLIGRPYREYVLVISVLSVPLW